MENHNSCEKLVDVEGGLIMPEKLTNFLFFTRLHRKESLNKFTNYLSVLLAIVLIVFTFYGIWQMVRGERLIKQLEDQKSLNLTQQLPMVPEDPEDPRIQYMADELKRVQNKLKEMEEKFDQRNPTPATTELPIKTNSQPTVDETIPDWDHVLLTSLLDENIDDRAKPSISAMTIPSYSPTAEIIGEDTSQDLDSWVPTKETEPIDETQPGFRWSFIFNVGENSGEHDAYEGLDVTESKETEAVPSTKTETVTSEKGWDDYISGIFFTPFRKSLGMAWGWGPGSIEEEVEERTDSVEIQTSTTTASAPVVSTVNNYPYDEYNFDSYESYDYPASSKEHSFGFKYENQFIEEVASSSTEYTPTDASLENDTSESSSAATVSEGMGQAHEPTTTEAAVSSSPDLQIYEFSFGDELDGDENVYESLADILSRSLGLGATSNSEDAQDELPSTEARLEESSKQDDLLTDDERIEKYFRDLLTTRLAEVKFWEQQHTTKENGGEYDDVLDGGDYDDDYVNPIFPLMLKKDDFSYISKRSVDTAASNETRGNPLSAKELAQKMVLLQQEIDDDNHLLQNEVNLTSEPTKHRLQEKLNNFYTNMATVSAHIDRLHERYLRLNKLDDDYISREFPSEDVESK